MPDVWLEISNSELNAFYLELIIHNYFYLTWKWRCLLFQDWIDRKIFVTAKKKRLKPKPRNFSGLTQIKHTVGPAMTVRFPLERDSLDSGKPIRRKEQIWGRTVPKENSFIFIFCGVHLEIKCQEPWNKIGYWEHTLKKNWGFYKCRIK